MVARKATNDQQTTDVAKADILTDEIVKGFTSVEDAVAFLTSQFGESAVVLAHKELGDGFALLEDKNKLVDTPLIFLDWTFLKSTKANGVDNGKEFPGKGFFTSVRVLTRDGKKYRINDGGTGLNSQLWSFTAQRGGDPSTNSENNPAAQTGLLAERGLLRSEYTNADGIDGTTFYINTSEVVR